VVLQRTTSVKDKHKNPVPYQYEMAVDMYSPQNTVPDEYKHSHRIPVTKLYPDLSKADIAPILIVFVDHPVFLVYTS
jgi:hypothetical protein